jgi:hypothetical protein
MLIKISIRLFKSQIIFTIHGEMSYLLKLFIINNVRLASNRFIYILFPDAARFTE